MSTYEHHKITKDIENRGHLVLIVLSYRYTTNSPSLGKHRSGTLRELYCGVHDKLHISSAYWWDLLRPLA